MKKQFTRLLFLPLFTFLVMSLVTYDVIAQVKNVKKPIPSVSPVQPPGNIRSDIIKPPLPIQSPYSTINCYPVNAARNTGSVNSTGTITQTSLVDCIGATEEGWIKFDLSSIPAAATITGVTINFYVETTVWPYFNVNRVTNDPVTAAGLTLWNEINAGATNYLTYTGAAIPVGWNAFALNAVANGDVQSQIGSWWATGFLETDFTPTYYFTADGWNEANKPYITVTYSTGPIVDAQTSAVWMPTSVPEITFSPFTSQKIPWTAIVKNGGTNPATFNNFTDIYKGGILDATFPSNIVGLAPGSSQTLTGNYTVTSNNNYTLFNQTLLAGDIFPTNDSMSFLYTCAIGPNDSVFAWDKGTPYQAIGYGGPPCFFGSTFTLSAQDTFTSASICWGVIPGPLVANTVEIWNTAGGAPTTFNSMVAIGITLTPADNFTFRTYEAMAPIVLPAGTYFLAAHQTATLSGTYLLAFDNGPIAAPWNVTTCPRNISFYSGDGITWGDIYAVGFYEVGMTRANFGITGVSYPPIVTTTAPTSITQISAISGGDVIGGGTTPVTARGVCWNTTGNPTTTDPHTIDGSGLGVFVSNIAGLTANTTYHVRAYATNTIGTSYGSDIQFTTPCAAITSFPYNYDFAAALDPCWSVSQVAGTGNWVMAASQTYPFLPPESGTELAYFNSFNFATGTVSRLNTPPFNFSALSNPIVQFYMTQDVGYPGSNDEVMVEASIDGGATWITLATFLRYNTAFTTPGWDLKTVDLTPYGGMPSVILSFKATSYFGNDLSIDNVTVKLPVPNDVGTFSVDVTDVNPIATVAPKATVKNFGSAIQSFPVNMTITGGYSSTKPVVGLAPGASVQVTFDPWTPATNGSYLVHVCTQLPGDANPGNDCMDKTVWAYNGSWSSGQANPFGMYLGSGVGYMDNAKTTGYLFSIGGIPNAPGTGAECYKYNVNTATWAAIASLPAPRNRHTTANVGHNIYTIGGCATTGSDYQSTVFKYDINNDPGGWTAVASLPIVYGWGKAVGHNNHIYLVGGLNGTNAIANVYVYDTVTNVWSSATPLPVAVFGGACSVVGNQIIYVGGTTDASVVNTVYVGTIDGGNPLLITWVLGASYPGIQNISPRVSGNPASTAPAAQDLQKGKIKSGKSNSGNTELDSPYPPGTMYRFDGAPWGGNSIIVAGGSPDWNWVPAMPNPCWVYNPATNMWRKQGDVVIPTTAATLGSVNLGNNWDLVVAGGYSGSAILTNTQVWTDVFLPSGLSLTFKAIIQGFYNGTVMIPDSVHIELHNSTSPYALVETKKVVLNSSGAGNPVFTTAVNGTPYFIVVKHRNSIETWSANPQVFSGSALTYDFTTSASQAYGSNQILVGTKWCIYSGDVNQDRSVDALDMILIDNDVANFITGYVPTDVNGDGAVDALDMIICDNNSSNFVGAIVPPGAMTVKIPKTYEQMQAIEKYMKNRTEQKQINDKIQKDAGTKPVKKSNNN